MMKKEIPLGVILISLFYYGAAITAFLGSFASTGIYLRFVRYAFYITSPAYVFIHDIAGVFLIWKFL